MGAICPGRTRRRYQAIGDESSSRKTRLLNFSWKLAQAAGDVGRLCFSRIPNQARRYSAGYLQQDLVLAQPMSLSSGLVFFLDFTLGTNRDESADPLNAKGKSIGQVVEYSQLTGGVDLSIPDVGLTSNDGSYRAGAYDLANGHSTNCTLDVAAGLVELKPEVDIRALTASANADLFAASSMTQIFWVKMTLTWLVNFELQKLLRLR